MDKVTATVVEALKQALAGPGEQRLFRSGKLPGAFAGRTGVNAEAATRALRDGLVEVVRTETSGKTVVEWVRVTPKGVTFLHDHDSPARAMEELRDALRLTREGIPGWLAEMHATLAVLGTRLTEEVQAIARRLEALTQRVNQALEKSQATPLSEDTAQAVPWAPEALHYLDRRQGGGLSCPCPLAELFAAVQGPHSDLTLNDFHTGLRRLHDRGVVRLLPSADLNQVAEPEYALLDGVTTYCYVLRRNGQEVPAAQA